MRVLVHCAVDGDVEIEADDVSLWLDSEGSAYSYVCTGACHASEVRHACVLAVGLLRPAVHVYDMLAPD